MKIQNKSYLVNACTMLIGIGLQSMEHNIPGIIMISVGIIGIFATLAYGRWKQWKNKKTTNNPDKVAVLKFPNVTWLLGKQVIDKYSISAIELYQHIKNGLDIYPKDFSTIMMGDQAQPLSEYDIGFEIDFDISNSSEMYDFLKNYHFKVYDIEEYLKTNT